MPFRVLASSSPSTKGLPSALVHSRLDKLSPAVKRPAGVEEGVRHHSTLRAHCDIALGLDILCHPSSLTKDNRQDGRNRRQAVADGKTIEWRTLLKL